MEMTNPKYKTQKKRIGVLMYPGCVALDLVGPIEAFNYVNLINTEGEPNSPPGYEICLIAENQGPVESMSGVRLYADESYHNFQQHLDILLVPGMRTGEESYKGPQLLAWIKSQASRSQRVASVCSGAYVLAHAGLLSGHKVTTHWNHGEALQRAYPDVKVDTSQIHCKSGKIYSSAGVTAGIDLALSIIEEDFGRATSLKIAKRMVVFLKRPGDQSQFSDLLNAQTTATRFALFLEWIESNLNKKLTIDTMANQCAMSPRNFSRAFKEDMSISPMNYIRIRRLERARLLLEDSDVSISMIARKVGFISSDQFSRSFQAACHTSPRDYRRRFR